MMLAMKSQVVLVPVLILVIAQVLNGGGQTPAPVKTVWNGVYSALQAARGEEPYKARCARCHGVSLEGTQGNGLVGKDFMERWREDTMGSLFEFVSEGMPPPRPREGRPLISIPTYLDIISYILAQNQFPAGANALTQEGLDSILIQYQDGPRPLPHGALVQVTGCMSGSGQAWTVTSATEPVRTRSPQTNNYEEFKAAEAAPAGNQTYRLANLGFLGTTFKPETLSGAKLLVKGNLVRQTDSMRISILGIRKIADTCQGVQNLQQPSKN
jgi:S-disulfanyl-L-cysteine oxidoreductase SoxD